MQRFEPEVPMRVLSAALFVLATAAAAREPIIGLPCEGCEAVFEGMPAKLSARARIAPQGEPGEPLSLAGRVLAADGSPRAGVVVYAYHTDAQGIYPPLADAPGRAAGRHGRLRGWSTSDAEGRYAFDTIRPGSYPGRDVPAHIHLHVLEPGCGTYYIDDVMFTDDPLLTPAQRRAHAAGRGGDGIATPTRVEEGWHVVRDIRLGAGIPDHRPCATLPAARTKAAAAACAWDAAFVSASTTPLPAERFRGIDEAMAIGAIVQRLGPAARDVGSGLHVLEWDVTDGRGFLVSATDACAKPVKTGFRDHAED
jgi:protocatechuate 3,4-dioxygenase beta subunit